MKETITVLPYAPSYLKSSFRRVVVKPIEKAGGVTEAGLIIPTDIGRICDIGQVFASDAISGIHAGDIVMYQKLDRASAEHLDVVSYDDTLYDVLYENELWSVNDFPLNKIFVLALTDATVNESGLLIPQSVRADTQKGIVFRSDPKYSISCGDKVEYRKAELGIYPTIVIEGQTYDVLNETDVFIVNDSVAPYRIIVKIDKVAQQRKRGQSDSGLLRSPLYEFMKFNLQYGEVLEIGDEAAKLYPEISVGDIAILHHTVEDKTQNYRIVKQIASPQNVLLYEHRIINAYDTSNREILGRIANQKEGIISGYGKSTFFKWDIELLAKTPVSLSLITDFETNLDNCHNLADLVDTVGKKKKEYTDKASAKVRGYSKLLATTNPSKNKDEFDRLESNYKAAEKEAMQVALYLNANHLVICKNASTGERVVFPYRELYPIEVMGKKYIIGYADYAVATIVGSPE